MSSRAGVDPRQLRLQYEQSKIVFEVSQLLWKEKILKSKNIDLKNSYGEFNDIIAFDIYTYNLYISRKTDFIERTDEIFKACLRTIEKSGRKDIAIIHASAALILICCLAPPDVIQKSEKESFQKRIRPLFMAFLKDISKYYPLDEMALGLMSMRKVTVAKFRVNWLKNVAISCLEDKEKEIAERERKEANEKKCKEEANKKTEAEEKEQKEAGEKKLKEEEAKKKADEDAKRLAEIEMLEQQRKQEEAEAKAKEAKSKRHKKPKKKQKQKQKQITQTETRDEQIRRENKKKHKEEELKLKKERERKEREEKEKKEKEEKEKRKEVEEQRAKRKKAAADKRSKEEAERKQKLEEQERKEQEQEEQKRKEKEAREKAEKEKAEKEKAEKEKAQQEKIKKEEAKAKEAKGAEAKKEAKEVKEEKKPHLSYTERDRKPQPQPQPQTHTDPKNISHKSSEGKRVVILRRPQPQPQPHVVAVVASRIIQKTENSAETEAKAKLDAEARAKEAEAKAAKAKADAEAEAKAKQLKAETEAKEKAKSPPPVQELEHLSPVAQVVPVLPRPPISRAPQVALAAAPVAASAVLASKAAPAALASPASKADAGSQPKLPCMDWFFVRASEIQKLRESYASASQCASRLGKEQEDRLLELKNQYDEKLLKLKAEMEERQSFLESQLLEARSSLAAPPPPPAASLWSSPMSTPMPMSSYTTSDMLSPYFQQSQPPQWSQPYAGPVAAFPALPTYSMSSPAYCFFDPMQAQQQATYFAIMQQFAMMQQQWQQQYAMAASASVLQQSPFYPAYPAAAAPVGGMFYGDQSYQPGIAPASQIYDGTAYNSSEESAPSFDFCRAEDGAGDISMAAAASTANVGFFAPSVDVGANKTDAKAAAPPAGQVDSKIDAAEPKKDEEVKASPSPS
ncbi:MAG: hypothetical protein M1561_04670 [Gammaproteobacteria bacterium]|nr:hypothetical protein [Gammaproteobacteria bacterium]